MEWKLKAEEFVNLVNQSITPESGLRHITVEDLRRWTEMGLFHRYPEYCRAELQTAIALLRLEAEAIQRARSSLAQPTQVQKTEARGELLQRGVVQVVCCVASNLIEEQLIIQWLKDTNLVAKRESLGKW